MARTSLGSLNFASHTLGYLEDAIRSSFEARRGKLYNALRALNALLAVDLARQVVIKDLTPREFDELTWTSLESQMEKELNDQFRFAYVAGMARRKFDDLDGVADALEQLIPEFVAEHNARASSGSLERKGGVLRWLTGTQEVGSVDDLLEFCRASLWFAENVLDDDSEFEHLAVRFTTLTDSLPR